MSLYENEICPVCKNKFCSGDDIVVCPECGTPHHRDCYNLAGKCVNTGLHKAGYDYRREQKENENMLHGIPTAQNNNSAEQNDIVLPIIGETENDKGTDSNQKQPVHPVDIFKITETDSVYEKDKQTIDGESVADFASAIKINIPRFVNKFKEMEIRNKKAGWNWCALLFGSIYLFARKMYKQGTAFLCLTLSILFTGSALTYKFAPNYSQAVQNLVQSAEKTKQLTPQDILSLNSIGDAKNAVIISYVCLGVFIFLRIIQAVYADYFYKKTISSVIKRINNDFDDITFLSNPITGFDENMSKEQLKKMMLAQKGGVSFFIPAIVVWLIIMMMML